MKTIFRIIFVSPYFILFCDDDNIWIYLLFQTNMNLTFFHFLFGQNVYTVYD